MAEGGVGVAFLHRATRIYQGGSVPVGVLECVQAFIQSAVGVGVPIPQDQSVHINRAPDIPGHGIRPDLGFQQLPIAAEEPIRHRGADGVGHMTVQCIGAVGDDHHIRRVFNLDDLVPGVVDEAVVILVRRQVAVVVVGGGGGAADGGDFVLLVGGACLCGAVGGDGVPVTDGIVVPGLAV